MVSVLSHFVRVDSAFCCCIAAALCSWRQSLGCLPGKSAGLKMCSFCFLANTSRDAFRVGFEFALESFQLFLVALVCQSLLGCCFDPPACSFL